jgi:hypothetical protein
MRIITIALCGGGLAFGIAVACGIRYCDAALIAMFIVVEGLLPT